MRQMAALLSFWQNGSASDHFREGKRGSKSDSSKQTCIAQAVRPAVLRGRVCPERCAAGYLCPSHRLSSPLWNVAAQPCRGRIAGACVQACEPLRTRRATRLIPFLPTLVEALERHEHLHLTEECRRQLLSMSAATADRLLRSQRKVGQRGLSTTRAGTLLKQQIPIRTFEEWKETRPGAPTLRGLPVHVDPHRYSHRVDGMSSSSAPKSGNGAGSSPASTNIVPLSDLGDRYR